MEEEYTVRDDIKKVLEWRYLGSIDIRVMESSAAVVQTRYKRPLDLGGRAGRVRVVCHRTSCCREGLL